MKKLSLYESTNFGNVYLTDSVVVKVDGKDAIATWKWDEEFDLAACASFYDAHRDIIQKLGAPFNLFDDSKRLFLLGCSFGRETVQCEDIHYTDILHIDIK